MIKLFCDTETYKEIYKSNKYDMTKLSKGAVDYLSKQRAYLVGAIDETGKFQWWKNTQEFIEYLMKLPDDTIELYFYNATYDLQIIINDVLKFGYHLSPRTLNFDENKNYINGYFRIYYSKYQYENGDIKRDNKGKTVKEFEKTKTVIVHDLWMFNRANSYDKWSKYFSPDNTDKQKGKIDYNKNDVYWDGEEFFYYNDNKELIRGNLELELDYLKRDVMWLPNILKYKEEFIDNTYEIMKLDQDIPDEVIDEYEEVDEKTPLTISSIMAKITSLYMIKNGYKLGYKLFRPEVEEEMNEIMENSYLGGYTFQNINREEWDNVWKLDVNSEYPFQEFSRLMPTGLPSKTKPTGDYLKWIMLKVKDYQFNKKYSFLSTPLIPEYKLNKKMFLTYEYFELLQEKGKFIDLEIYGIYYTPATSIMKEIIGLLYSLKSDAPNKEIRTQCKLLLNSSYGRKAMKSKNTSYTFEWDDTYKHYHLTLKTKKDKEFYSNLCGVYIAQSARLTLFEGIDECLKYGEVAMGDTDSVFTTADPSKLNLKIDSKEIGAWDIESVFEKDNISTPKPYSKLKYIVGIRKKYYAWYDEDKNQNSLAFSGIPTQIIKQLSHNDRLKVFNPNNNVLFKNAKKASRENIFGQKQIYMTDFAMNNKIEPTHICYYNEEENLWVLEDKQ